MNDKKIISAITARDERMLAFVVNKYSKLLWKIAASVWRFLLGEDEAERNFPRQKILGIDAVTGN